MPPSPFLPPSAYLIAALLPFLACTKTRRQVFSFISFILISSQNQSRSMTGMATALLPFTLWVLHARGCVYFAWPLCDTLGGEYMWQAREHGWRAGLSVSWSARVLLIGSAVLFPQMPVSLETKSVVHCIQLPAPPQPAGPRRHHSSLPAP